MPVWSVGVVAEQGHLQRGCCGVNARDKAKRLDEGFTDTVQLDCRLSVSHLHHSNPR